MGRILRLALAVSIVFTTNPAWAALVRLQSHNPVHVRYRGALARFLTGVDNGPLQALEFTPRLSAAAQVMRRGGEEVYADFAEALHHVSVPPETFQNVGEHAAPPARQLQILENAVARIAAGYRDEIIDALDGVGDSPRTTDVETGARLMALRARFLPYYQKSDKVDLALLTQIDLAYKRLVERQTENISRRMLRGMEGAPLELFEAMGWSNATPANVVARTDELQDGVPAALLLIRNVGGMSPLGNVSLLDPGAWLPSELQPDDLFALRGAAIEAEMEFQQARRDRRRILSDASREANKELEEIAQLKRERIRRRLGLRRARQKREDLARARRRVEAYVRAEEKRRNRPRQRPDRKPRKNLPGRASRKPGGANGRS